MMAEHEALHAELEHRMVVGALRRLAAAAARFAEALKLHALSEEQILYPAALLVGEYVRARMEK